MHSSLRLLRVASTLASLGALLFVPDVAHAQGRDPVAATELFTQGREMLKNGDLEKACPLFAESLRLDPAVGTAMNLAECEERRGQLTSALRAWQQAINLAEANNDERGQVAQQRYDALLPTVPRLTIVLAPNAPEGTTVMRKDVLLGSATLGRSLPVDPGTYVVTVTAPGRKDTRVTIVLDAGDTRTLTVSPGALRDPEPVRDPVVEVKDDGKTQRTLAYVLGGVGIAGIVAATVSGVMLIDTRKRVDEHCDDSNRCEQEGLDAADRGKILVPVNTIAWVVGVAGLGAGTYFYLSAPPPPSVGSPSGAYLQLRGTF